MNRREFNKVVAYSCVSFPAISIVDGKPLQDEVGYGPKQVTGIRIDISDLEGFEAMKESLSRFDCPDRADVRVKLGKVERKFTYDDFFGRLGFNEQT